MTNIAKDTHNTIYVLINKFGYAGTFNNKQDAQVYIDQFNKYDFVTKELSVDNDSEHRGTLEDNEIYVVPDKNYWPHYVGYNEKEAIKIYEQLFLLGFAYERTINECKQDIGYAPYNSAKID